MGSGMKLIYAFPEPLPLERARGLQAVSTVAALGRAGVDVAFAYVPVPGTDPFDYYGVARPDNVSLVPLSRSLPWPLDRIHSNRVFFARLRRHFGERLQQLPLMVRHLKLAAMLADKVPAVRMIYEAHEVFGDTAAEARREANRDLERRVRAHAAAIVANSAATARRFAELYASGAPITVIPNGVARPEQLPAKPWQQAARHIIYAGSFFPWKGVAELIEASAQLPGCTLTLIGGDAARIAEMRAAAKPGGAELVFIGHLPHAEVMTRLAGACIAVLPNRDDTDSAFTSPIKLFEYMAADCAIVASDLPSLREILAEDEAAWFKAGDATALAAAIRRLADSPELAAKLGEAARARSVEFTWDARARRLMAVLEPLGARP